MSFHTHTEIERRMRRNTSYWNFAMLLFSTVLIIILCHVFGHLGVWAARGFPGLLQ